jgi:monoamine oxidase
VADRIDADVCVVGAGFAGLTAALRLQHGGRSVVVLEARRRVGGRIWTEALPDGTPIDRGGAWLAPRHQAALALAGEFGVSTYKTWVKGSHLLVHGGHIRRYTGLIPKIGPLAVLTIALAQARIDLLAKRVPLDAPWKARRAKEWDARTLADWFEGSGLRNPAGRDLFEMAVRGLFTSELSQTSFLHLLFLVRAHGSIGALFSIKGGAQENLVDGGAGSIAFRVADALGDSVRLGAPVRTITQHDDHVVVGAGDVSVSARRAVVTIPPPLVLGIDFEPALPDERRALYEKALVGLETKTLLVYDQPFWRELGLSGQSAEPNSASEVTIDATPSSGSPGVIASFTFGPVAERLQKMEAGERRRAVVDAFGARFGPRALNPTAFVETAWWEEQWSRGCSLSHFPPGFLTRYGPLLRQPLRRIHWAGTETATRSHGAIDGAILSGERAAAEVLAAG